MLLSEAYPTDFPVGPIAVGNVPLPRAVPAPRAENDVKVPFGMRMKPRVWKLAVMQRPTSAPAGFIDPTKVWTQPSGEIVLIVPSAVRTKPTASVLFTA